MLGDAIRLITGILSNAPDVRILATSREAFDSLRERVVEVGPLSLPAMSGSADLRMATQTESMRLLVDRVVPVRPDFRLDETNWRIVAEVCRRLEGNPLAIELVAPRLRSLTLEQLVSGLDDRLSLASNDRSVPERHRSIRDMIAWSWNTCTDSERAVWRRCAVFSGGFDLSASEIVCSDADVPREAVWQILDHLVAKSLVVAVADSESMRFRQLEMISEFGREQLRMSGEADAVAERHFRCFAQIAHEVVAVWPEADQQSAVWMMRRERSNFARALEWGLTNPGRRAEACRLAVDLRIHWAIDGYLSDGRRWLGRVLELEPDDPRDRCDALWVLAWLEILHGDLAVAEVHLADAERWAVGLADESVLGHIEALLGTTMLWRGLPEAAWPVLQRGHERARTVEDSVPGPRFVGMLTALALVDLGEHVRLQELEDLHADDERPGLDRWGGSQLEWAFALAAWRSGRLDEADWRFRRAFESNSAFDRVGTALKVDVRSWLAVSRGEYVRAAMLSGAAASIWSNLGTSISAFGSTLAQQAEAAEANLRLHIAEPRLRSLLAAGAALDYDALVRLATGGEVPGVDDSGDDPLTPREREIGELLGEGLSNRQIATRLVLSPRTVEGHISRILAKLQLESRGQITAWALRHSSEGAESEGGRRAS